MIGRAASFELEGAARALAVGASLAVVAILQVWVRWSLRREERRRRQRVI